jgi:hypothetical protein
MSKIGSDLRCIECEGVVPLAPSVRTATAIRDLRENPEAKVSEADLATLSSKVSVPGQLEQATNVSKEDEPALQARWPKLP